VQNGSVMAGQIAAMVVKAESSREIIDDLLSGTLRVIRELEKMFCQE